MSISSLSIANKFGRIPTPGGFAVSPFLRFQSLEALIVILPSAPNHAAHHATTVENHRYVALAIKPNDAAIAMLCDKFLHHYIGCRLLQRDVEVS